MNSGYKNECYGCKACAEVCPKNCVSIAEDSEHFFYPFVNYQECINCHLCEKTCPYGKPLFHDKDQTEVWVGRHVSDEVLLNSSSGGVYTAIYKTLLSEHYIFYGVRWDENFKVIHDSANTEEECKRFRKSKYVLSDTNHVFSRVEDNLRRNEKVCFSGTPCQCAALISFLETKKVSMDALIVVDIICHGAPNQYIFDRYIEEMIGSNEDFCSYSFRFKNKIPYCGKINSRSAELKSPQGESVILDATNDPFLRGYYGRLFYRPSCGSCAFARPQRVSDITIGDAWHIEEVYPEWQSLEGVSLMLLNTEKGKCLFEKLRHQMDLRKMSIEWAVKTNAQLREPTQMHKSREKFFRRIDRSGFKESVDTAMNDNAILCMAKKIKHAMVRPTHRGVELCDVSECRYNHKGTCTL